jgi:tRNA pseudouridine38-40 synthase
MGRRNFLLSLAYDGSDFQGWQRGTAKERTVQAEVEACLGRILGEPVEITGASRTDAGVHAEGQAASFHSRTELAPERLVVELNKILPPDIACRACEEVDPRFHARYRAKAKLYRYRLQVGGIPDPFERRYALHVEGPLDLAAMEEAAALFSGEHDFRGFTNAKAVEDGRRRMERVSLAAEGRRVDLLFLGEAFMFNQVRIMAGALLEVGRGRLRPAAVAQALATGDRTAMPGALGAFGLCLVEVRFR